MEKFQSLRKNNQSLLAWPKHIESGTFDNWSAWDWWFLPACDKSVEPMNPLMRMCPTMDCRWCNVSECINVIKDNLYIRIYFKKYKRHFVYFSKLNTNICPITPQVLSTGSGRWRAKRPTTAKFFFIYVAARNLSFGHFCWAILEKQLC